MTACYSYNGKVPMDTLVQFCAIDERYSSLKKRMEVFMRTRNDLPEGYTCLQIRKIQKCSPSKRPYFPASILLLCYPFNKPGSACPVRFGLVNSLYMVWLIFSFPSSLSKNHF